MKGLRLTYEQYLGHVQKTALAQSCAVPSVKPSKYGNTPTEVDGIKFASKREAQRFSILRLKEKAGEIRGLVLQPRYSIDIQGQHICTYVADFSYWEGERFVVEDAKGMKTPVYKLKKKLMKACYGFDVTEV